MNDMSFIIQVPRVYTLYMFMPCYLITLIMHIELLAMAWQHDNYNALYEFRLYVLLYKSAIKCMSDCMDYTTTHWLTGCPGMPSFPAGPGGHTTELGSKWTGGPETDTSMYSQNAGSADPKQIVHTKYLCRNQWMQLCHHREFWKIQDGHQDGHQNTQN